MKAFAPRCLILFLMVAAGAGFCLTAQAGPLRDFFTRKEAVRATESDVPYGPHKDQKMDIYMPQMKPVRQIIVMVHGGAWKIGDKAYSRVIENKVPYFTHQGAAFVSINYRLVPDVTPAEQLEDVFAALRAVQQRAADWGVDPSRLVLMGHSAGAHLVALAAAQGGYAGVRPWMGTVVLDSAAMDVPAIMQAKHMGFYDEAFGRDPARWRQLSPLHNLQRGARPLLLVCSLRREEACAQARAFAAAAEPLGVQVGLLPQDLSHGQINEELGAREDYTRAVQGFMDALH